MAILGLRDVRGHMHIQVLLCSEIPGRDGPDLVLTTECINATEVEWALRRLEKDISDIRQKLRAKKA